MKTTDPGLEPAARAAIDDFVAQKTLAVVGVSRQGKKFGNVAYRELKAKGYRVFPVHPAAESIDGDRCYPDLRSIPERLDGVLVVLPPARTEQVVEEAIQAGVPRLWMQQGAESAAAVRRCREAGVQVVHGQCILMFAEPVGSIHVVHHWLWRVLGKLPK
jgi:predicted CoA-binding protein